jgi:hypothetical protein
LFRCFRVFKAKASTNWLCRIGAHLCYVITIFFMLLQLRIKMIVSRR